MLASLGTWQLQRRAWKLDLIEKIEARAYGAPGAILPEAEWPRWSAEDEEYRRVRVSGRFLHEHEVRRCTASCRAANAGSRSRASTF